MNAGPRARPADRPGHALRVCHVIHSLQPGGAEQSLLELAQVAPAAGMRLAVVSLTDGTPGGYPDRLRAAGVEVRLLGLPTRWDPRAVQSGIAAVRAVEPHLVHSHLKHADLVAAAAARRLRLPMVSSLHVIEDDVTGIARGKRWLAAQARLRGAALTIAVSDAVRRWYLAAFSADPDRVVTVHNGVAARPAVDDAARAAVRAEFGIPADAVLATMVGVLRPGKGHLDLLAALEHVPRRLGVHVLIVGDGALRATLAAAVGAAPYADRVTFAGYRTDVPRILAASDLVVHPSHFDAFPTVLLETAAAGRPAVATAVGGTAEIVTPDTGVLVPPADPTALGAAIAELAAAPVLRERLGAAARHRFAAEFEATRWAERLRAQYERVLAERSR